MITFLRRLVFVLIMALTVILLIKSYRSDQQTEHIPGPEKYADSVNMRVPGTSGQYVEDHKN